MFQFLLHHLWPTFLVQVLFGNPPDILSCVRTCPECVGASTLFSLVPHWPTHPLVGSLVSATHSWLSHSTDYQHTNSRIASPKRYRPQDISQNASLLFLSASARENSSVRSSLPTQTPRIPLTFNLVPSSEWSRPKRVRQCGPCLEDYDTTFSQILSHEDGSRPMHCAEPSDSSALDQVQILLKVLMRQLHEMLETVPELSNLHAPSSLSSILASQSQQDSWIGTV